MSDIFDDLFQAPSEASPINSASAFDDLFSDEDPSKIEEPQTANFDSLFETPKTRDILAKKLQEAGLYGSATSAMSGSWFGDNSNLTKDENGKWLAPAMRSNDGGLVDSVMGALTMLEQKAGLGMNVTSDSNEQKIQDVLNSAQQESGSSDMDMVTAWDDIKKSVTKFDRAETARVLSDGRVLPNMDNSDWLDDEKAKQLLNTLPITDENKKLELSNLERTQRLIAANKLEAYTYAAVGTTLEDPATWADRTGRSKAFGTKEFVKDYEAEVASKAGWGQGLGAGVHKGNLKLAMTLTGAAGMISGDKDIAREAGELAYASAMLSKGSVDMGLVGSVQEELPSILAIAALTRGVGFSAGTAGGAMTAGTAGELVGAGVMRSAASKITGIAAEEITRQGMVQAATTTASTAAMLGGSYIQSAGATFASQIQEGDTIAEAREKANKAGLTTLLVTGLFQAAGMGGLEKDIVGKAGKKAHEITIGEVVKSIPKGELIKTSKAYAKSLGMAYVSEAAEEGIDEAIQAFATADKDTSLADAWANAWDAAKIGGFIGGVSHVASTELSNVFGDKAADALRLTPQSVAALTRAGKSLQDSQPSALPAHTAEAVETRAKLDLENLKVKRDSAQAPLDEATSRLSEIEKELGTREEPIDPGDPSAGFKPYRAITTEERELIKRVESIEAGEEVASTQSVLSENESQQLAVLESFFEKDGSFNQEKAAQHYQVSIVSDPANQSMDQTAMASSPSASSGPVSFSVGSTTLQANDNTPQSKLEALFGQAPSGKEYKADIDPSKIQADPKTGRITYDGENTTYVMENGKAVAKRDPRNAGRDPMIMFTKKVDPLTAASEVKMSHLSVRSAKAFASMAPENQSKVKSGDLKQVFNQESIIRSEDNKSYISNGVSLQSQTTAQGKHPDLEFDSMKKSLEMADADPIVQKKILAEWEAARKAGDVIHAGVSNAIDKPESSKNPRFNAIAEFIKSRAGIGVKINSEVKVADDRLAGTIDISYLKSNGKWTIVDIKNSKSDPTSGSGKNYYKKYKSLGHQVQLHGYASILAENGMEVDEVLILPVTSNGDMYYANGSPVTIDAAPSSQAVKILDDIRSSPLPKESLATQPDAGSEATQTPKNHGQETNDKRERQALEGQVLIQKESEQPSKTKAPAPVVAEAKPVEKPKLSRAEIEYSIKKTQESIAEIDAMIEDDSAPPSAAAKRDDLTKGLEELKKQLDPNPPSLKAPSKATIEAPIKSSVNVSDDFSLGEMRRSGEGAEIVGDDTDAGPLDVNMMVNVTGKNGGLLHSRVVIGSYVNEDGKKVYVLSRPINADEKVDEELYQKIKAPGSDKELADGVSIASNGDQRNATLQVGNLLKSVFERVASKRMSLALFRTNSTSGMGEYNPNDDTISFTPESWLMTLRSRLNGIKSGSQEESMIVEDWISEMEKTIFEELRHKFFVDQLKLNPVIATDAISSLLKHGKTSKETLERLHASAIGRYGHKSNYEGKLANITPDQLLQLLNGEEVNGVLLTKEELDQEMIAIAAEFDAAFVQSLTSGMSTTDVRAAADRFAASLIGDPTGVDASRLGTMLKRITELFMRSVEAMQRFMKSHRLAKTLPKDYYNFSVMLDGLMAAKGITAPDATKVIERFNERASSKMRQVDTIRAILEKRTWEETEVDPITGKPANKSVTDYQLKARVREIINQSLSINPNIKPVSMNPVTGRMEANKSVELIVGEGVFKALESALERLNNPMLSTVALEATEIAKDVRSVMRYLNRGAFVADSKFLNLEGQTINENGFGSMTFDQASQAFAETLTSEIEDVTGYSVNQILEQYNRFIDQSKNSTSDPVPQGMNAVSDKLRELRPSAWAELEDKKETILEEARNGEEIAGDLSRKLETGNYSPSVVKAQQKKIAAALKRSASLRDRAQAFKRAQDVLMNSYINYTEPSSNAVRFDGFERAKIIESIRIRDELKLAVVRQRKAESETRLNASMRNRQFSQTRSIGDLAALNLSSEELSRIFTAQPEGSGIGLGPNEFGALPDINFAKMEATLSKYQSSREAFARVSVLPNHLEYTLLGGYRPKTIPRTTREEGRGTVGVPVLTSDGARGLLPMSAGRALWGIPVEGNLDLSLGGGLALEVEDEILGSYSFTTMDELPVAIDNQAQQIEVASRAVSHLLGYDPSYSMTESEKIDKASVIRHKARLIAQQVTEQFALARLEGDPSALGSAGHDSFTNHVLSTVEQGGFPSELFETRNGVLEPVMPSTLMPNQVLPEMVYAEDGKFDFVASLDNIYANGAAAETLLAAVRFMKSIEGSLNNGSQAVLWTGNGMTPAGVSYAALTPRFLKFLALTKDNTANGSNYQQMMVNYFKNNKRAEDAAMIEEAFDKLAAGLHLSSEFKDERKGKNAKRSILHEFYSLRESMVAVDTIYKESLYHAQENIQSLYESKKDGVTDFTRSPIDERVISNHNFRSRQIKGRVDFLRGEGDWGNAAISQLIPQSASQALDDLNQLELQRGELELKGRAINAGRDTYGATNQDIVGSTDEPRLMRQGDNAQENTDLTPNSDQMTNAQREWQMEQYRREKESHMEREEEVLTRIALMEYGGSESAVRRVFNDKIFRNTEVSDNKTSLGWNRIGIAQHLRLLLEKRQKEEIESGATIGSYDSSGQKLITFDEEIESLLSRHGDEYRAMIDQMKLGRAYIHKQTSTTAFERGAIPRNVELDENGKEVNNMGYDAFDASVLHGLLSRIGNVTIITGSVNYSNMYGDEKTRVPSLAFIPDKTNPTLLLPYGKIDPTREEAILAIENALEWLHEHGKVNITALAQPIAEQLSQIRNPGRFKTNYAVAFEAFRKDQGIVVVSDLEYLEAVNSSSPRLEAIALASKYGVDNPSRLISKTKWDSRVKTWTASAAKQVNENVSRNVRNPDIDILSTEIIESALVPKFAPSRETSKKIKDAIARAELRLKNANPDIRSSAKRSVVALVGSERFNGAVDFEDAYYSALAGKGMTPAKWDTVKKASRKVLARVLADPSAKELFLLTSTIPNEFPITELDRSLFGNMVGFHSVRGMDMIAARDQLSHFRSQGLDVTDEIGRSSATVEARELGGFGIGEDNTSALNGLLDAMDGEGFASDFVPLSPLQAEWANSRLYQLLKALTPVEDPSAPLKGSEKPRKLSEFEARQLLSVFGNNAVHAAIEDVSSKDSRMMRWGNPGHVMVANANSDLITTRELSVNDITSAVDSATENLRVMFNSWAVVGSYPNSRSGDMTALELAERYGTYDMLRGTRSRWEQNRIAKGAILFAEEAGIEFKVNEGGSRFAVADPDLAAMEKSFKEKNLLKMTLTSLNAKGKPLVDSEGNPTTERVSIFDAARRDVFAEHNANVAFVNETRKEVEDANKLLNTQRQAIEAINSVLSGTQKSIDDLMDVFSGSDPVHKQAAKAIREFVSNREELARNLASDFLRRVENANFGTDNQFNPSASSAIGPDNDMVRRIGSIKDLHEFGLQNAIREINRRSGDTNVIVTPEGVELGPDIQNYNDGVSRLFDALHRVSPSLFPSGEAREYMVGQRDGIRQIRNKSANLQGLLKGLSNSRFLMEKAISINQDATMSSPLSPGITDSSRNLDPTLAKTFVSLSNQAQKELLDLLRQYNVQFGQRIGSALDPQAILDRATRVIYNDLYASGNSLEASNELKDHLASVRNEISRAMDDNRALRPDDILRIIQNTETTKRTLDDWLTDKPESYDASNHSPLLRYRAIAEMLRSDLVASRDMTNEAIRIRYEKIMRAMEPQYKLQGWREDGYGTLLLKPSAELGSKQYASSVQDVEVAYRVLNAYGKMWSDLYMRQYRLTDFAAGMSQVEEATRFADEAGRSGFGSMMPSKATKKAKKSTRLVDDLLPPETLEARAEAILNSRKAPSASRELVLARFRNWMQASPSPAGQMLASTGELGIDNDFDATIRSIRYGEPERQTIDKQIVAIDKEIVLTKAAIHQASSPSSSFDVSNLEANQAKLRQLEEQRQLLVDSKTVSSDSAKFVSSLFAPATPVSAKDEAEKYANLVMAKWNVGGTVRAIRTSRAQINRMRSGLGVIFKQNQTSDDITRDQMRFMLGHGMEMELGGQLIDIKNPDGDNLHAKLSGALQGMRDAPMDPGNRARFYKYYNQSHAALFANSHAELLAIGYVRTTNPTETGAYYRSFLHTSAKITGVFAKSNEAIDSANEVHSLLSKGAGGQTGKDRYLLQTKANNDFLASEAAKIDEKTRFEKTAKGFKLAQISSYFLHYGDNSKTADDLLSIMNASEDALARANRQSKGKVDHSASTFGAIASYIPRKLRQLYNHLFENGFHQRENQYIELGMISDVVPLLEKMSKGELKSEHVIAALRSKWGKEADNYANAVIDAYEENRKGYENIALMRGENIESIMNRPLVPFMWLNHSMESSTARKTGSMSDMLDLDRAIWTRSSSRSWDNEDAFDLLDYDGITAPMRMLDDMTYRTFVAPAYDLIAEIVGDVSTASDHFAQYSTDDLGRAKSGFIGARASELIPDANIASKAADGALAISNMVRDEIVNDMSGFSAPNRAISLYRKLAIIGLTRKLFSLSQAYAQPLSPVIGYAATNGKRGLGFVPVLFKYLSGIAPGQKNKDFAKLIQSLVSESGPVIARRGPDSNAMVDQVMRDHAVSGGDLYRSAYLGRADAVLGPVVRLGGAVVDLTAKASNKTLELLISRPESWVLVPMLAHEILSEVNVSRLKRGDAVVSMDQFLSDPKEAGMDSRHIRSATMRVEQLFGTSDPSQKGKLTNPSKTLHQDIWRSLLTTLSGHPIAMAANSWAAWRQIRNNSFGSKESQEGMRVLSMTVAQNVVFAFGTLPVLTYVLSSALASANGWDDDERREWEGWFYGIKPNEGPEERRKNLMYWVSSMLGRNEDPYGYSWHNGEYSEEQEKKHDGYRKARIAQEIVNQLPVVGSLSSTTLGNSILSAGMKAAGISPDSKLKQAGIILPEKWGFSGEAADPDGEAGRLERYVYSSTKFWNNYLNDANAIAFSIDPIMQAIKMAANDPDSLELGDVIMISTILFPNKPREFDRAATRQHSLNNPDFEWAAPWETR